MPVKVKVQNLQVVQSYRFYKFSTSVLNRFYMFCRMMNIVKDDMIIKNLILAILVISSHVPQIVYNKKENIF